MSNLDPNSKHNKLNYFKHLVAYLNTDENYAKLPELLLLLALGQCVLKI